VHSLLLSLLLIANLLPLLMDKDVPYESFLWIKVTVGRPLLPIRQDSWKGNDEIKLLRSSQ
jgi:hypothetical protein